MRRTLVPAIALALCAPVLAQTPAPSAPAAPPSTASAPASAAKKALVQKVLALQQPGIEAAARQLAEQPAAALLQRAGVALQQGVAADRREAVAKDIQADARAYADEAVPLLRKRAVEIAPTALGPLLEDRFNESELKQLLAFLESPVYRKYQQMGGEMQKALAERLVADTRGVIEPKLRTLEQQVSNKLAAAQKASAGVSLAPTPIAPGASGAAAPASR